MNYLFTSESVSEGHPDKVADQISDAIVDKLLAYDPSSKVACETLVTTGQVVIAGEVKSDVYIDLMDTARRVINKIGYTKSEYKFDGESCGILTAIHEQSGDINRGVEREVEEEQGAGDQGMMFGYACNETENYMPLTLDLAHSIMRELAEIRREGKVMTYLRPDSKSQVTVEYDENDKPVRIHTIVVSTQHDDFIQQPMAVRLHKMLLIQKCFRKLRMTLEISFFHALLQISRKASAASLTIILSFTLIRQESSLLVDLMEIPVLQEERLSLILTVAAVLMVAVHSLEKTHQRLTALQHTQRVILQRTLWQRALPTKCLFR